MGATHAVLMQCLEQESTGLATSTTVPAPSLPNDLRLIVDAWQSLPEPLRAGIVAMVRAAGTPSPSPADLPDPATV